jgi:hypothetical protein
VFLRRLSASVGVIPAPLAHTESWRRLAWAEYPFSFHDSEEVGPAMLAKIAKKTGLTPRDL